MSARSWVSRGEPGTIKQAVNFNAEHYGHLAPVNSCSRFLRRLNDVIPANAFLGASRGISTHRTLAVQVGFHVLGALNLAPRNCHVIACRHGSLTLLNLGLDRSSQSVDRHIKCSRCPGSDSASRNSTGNSSQNGPQAW